jgi:predicted AAA+ superfamily ATPase
LLENFVLMELRKQATWSTVQPRLFHYRTLAGEEVDLLLEDAAGRCVGIEVKASATLGARDVKPLENLAEALGKRFLRGIVLYTGRTAVPFGERLLALPISALWTASLLSD